MFDINLLRNDIAATAERMKARHFTIDTAAFEALEAERKALQIHTQELQQQRNTLSKAVGQAKAAKDDAKTQQLLAEVAAVPDKVKANELALAGVQGGDRLLEVDGQQVQSIGEIQAVIRKHGIGEELRLLVQRESEEPRQIRDRKSVV